MKVNVCDQCRKPLGDDYWHIPVMRHKFSKGGSWGKIVLRIGGRKLCEDCALAIAEMVNGDREIKKYSRGYYKVNPAEVCQLSDKGLTVYEIMEQTGLSETSIRRVLTARKKKKAVSEKI